MSNAVEKISKKNQDYFSSLHCPESIVEDPKEYRSSRMAFAETGISSVPVGPTRLLKEQFVWLPAAQKPSKSGKNRYRVVIFYVQRVAHLSYWWYSCNLPGPRENLEGEHAWMMCVRGPAKYSSTHFINWFHHQQHSVAPEEQEWTVSCSTSTVSDREPRPVRPLSSSSSNLTTLKWVLTRKRNFRQSFVSLPRRMREWDLGLTPGRQSPSSASSESAGSCPNNIYSR